MKIVACIKQVPASSDVEIDPVTGNLIRDGNNTKMNPYDLYGLETALQIKKAVGGTITALSMGPPQAKAVLNEAMWMGCDDGVLLSDRKLGGADVVATAYALSQGIEMIGNADLIVCGKQTTDGDTAQVGPEIAAYLNIPHASYVNKIIEVKEKSIVVQTNMDNSWDTFELNFPCLITVDKGIYTPRLPSYKRSRELRGYELTVWSVNDLPDKVEDNYGLKGSPTQVERMFPPEKNTDYEIWESGELGKKIADKLAELKVL